MKEPRAGRGWERQGESNMWVQRSMGIFVTYLNFNRLHNLTIVARDKNQPARPGRRQVRFALRSFDMAAAVEQSSGKTQARVFQQDVGDLHG